MVQELIPGDGQTQFSYAAVCERGPPIGSMVARRTRQYPVDFGFTGTLVESISSSRIEQLACRFIKSLDYSGRIEIELKYDVRDDQYKMLDVNTRARTWVALDAAAGVDFALLQWRLALGEQISAISARPGVAWRYLSRDLVAAAQEMLAGTISPTGVLRSLRHAAAGAVSASDDLLPAALDLPRLGYGSCTGGTFGVLAPRRDRSRRNEVTHQLRQISFFTSAKHSHRLSFRRVRWQRLCRHGVGRVSGAMLK